MILSTAEILLIVIIGVAILLILSNRIRADVVAIMVLLALHLTGVLTPEQAFSGFSRSVVFTLIGLFIISHALEETGVIAWIAARFNRLTGGDETRSILLIMGSGALLSVAMNTVAVGALLLPVAAQMARDSNIRTSKLLIPLSYGTLLGGTATIFTTANIVISGILQDQQLGALSFLDFVPTGMLIAVGGIVYMLLIGRNLLPAREGMGSSPSSRGLARTLAETYQLQERMWEVRILPNSKIAHQRLMDTQIGEELGLSVLAIWRGGHAILAPSPSDLLEVNDTLLVLGREDRVRILLLWGTTLARSEDDLSTPRRDLSVDLTEVVVAPRSSVIGRSLFEIGFRNKYGMTAVALWRGGRSYRTDVGKFTLQEGDALLMVGQAKHIRALQRDRDFILLQSSHAAQPPSPNRAAAAFVITTLVLLLSAFEILRTPDAMLIGALAMVLTGALSMDEAYRGISWRVIFLIAGMIPISLAMIETGLAQKIGDVVVMVAQPFGPLGLIAGLFVVTMAITQVLSGQVSAIMMGPIAITAALSMGVDPHAVGVATATACSAAFLIPTAHPINALMMGPGGYVPSDFLKPGLGLTIVMFVLLLLGMVVFWGIR